MTNPIISVIIPCYNSFKDMTKCLDSLEKQTFRDFEVIIINDCSKDDSLACLLEYSKESKLDIKIISNEVNRGPGYSRNIGINASRGKWISFCDADDWYPYDRFEKMLSAADEETDVVLCNMNRVYTTEKVIEVDWVSNLEKCESLIDFVAKSPRSFVLYLIKSEISKSIPIADLYNGEDYATIPLWLQNSRKFAFVNEPLYNYYTRQGSLSVKPSDKAHISFKKAFDYMKERSMSGYDEAVEYLGIYSVLYGGVLSALKAGIKTRDIKKYVDDFSSECPQWYSNKYVNELSKVKRLFLKMVKNKRMLILKLMAFAHKFLMKFM